MKRRRTRRRALTVAITAASLALAGACSSWGSGVDPSSGASTGLDDDGSGSGDSTTGPTCDCGACDLDCPSDQECYAECVLIDPQQGSDIPDDGRRFECQQRCIPAGACLYYDDCGEGQMCFNCTRTLFDENGEQFEEIDCDHEFGQCVPEVPSLCQVDADCAATEWYMPEGGRCMSGSCVYDDNACDDAHPCAGGMECRQRCWEGRCQDDASGLGSAECPQGEPTETVCDPVGYCVPQGKCLYDDECPDGQACQTCRFVQLDDERGEGQSGFECVDYGTCMPLWAETCQVDADCVANGWQPMEVGRCFGGICTYDPLACSADFPCGAGEECLLQCWEQCVRDDNDSSLTDSATGPQDCTEPEEICEAIGQCVPEGGCVYDHHCPDGFFCDGGQCRDRDQPPPDDHQGQP